MLTDEQIERYLAFLEDKILNEDKKSIELSRKWTKAFPTKPGVYMIFEGEKLVYVGETGNIRKRMVDLLDSRHHTLRRSLGKCHFSKEKGYKIASSKHKFPEHIEHKIAEWMEKKLRICSLPITVGRKELEERIQDKHREKLYNLRGRRAAG